MTVVVGVCAWVCRWLCGSVSWVSVCVTVVCEGVEVGVCVGGVLHLGM